ncbi:MAG: MOSC N-terminal beta barrel domain-containing protein [Burkholderiales bacterium]|nr:MOSC N-terminal beta barrel domain-containing protein [Burkholderiales bacterium]
MPTIAELNIYPIKSCAGIALQSATLTAAGLSYLGVHDREWMLVDEAGHFLSQRSCPALARLRPALLPGALVLNAPGLAPLALPLAWPEHIVTRTVQVWDDSVQAHDCGDAAANWCSSAAGVACRLVRFAPQAQRLIENKWTAGAAVPTRFSDAYPMLLIAAASLDDLNRRLQAQGQDAVPMNRFRPNIVLDGVAAYEEDYAEFFDIGDQIRLRPVKPCARCTIPAVDQLSGMPGFNPLDILQAYRANPLLDGGICFGMNAILERGAGLGLRIGAQAEMQIAF